MKTATFESVEEQDKVYSLEHGWGFVTSVNHDIAKFQVKFCNIPSVTYGISGKKSPLDSSQSLFWGIPQIIAPQRIYDE